MKDKDNKDKMIKTQEYTRLLGCNIGQNLGWLHHLETGKKALLPRLRKQLGAIKLLAKELPTKSKLLLSNGLIISKVCYMIQIWGAASNKLIRKVQVIVNQAARFITGANRRTRTNKLMESCKWLSVRELIDHQSLISMWIIVYLGIPAQIREHLAISDEHIITTRPARLKLVQRSFKHRTLKIWNNLPQEIRDTKKITVFKRNTKKWIMEQRNIQPG